MIKLENYEVVGWEHAIRGCRNPMNSWDKSDSAFESMEGCMGDQCYKCTSFPCNISRIGPNDLDLMKRLRNAGTDHRKFMRMITVYVDITAPLYWWKEFDTYKVGTVANSCSTMHKIAEKEFTLEDFSCEHLIGSKKEWVNMEEMYRDENFEEFWTSYDILDQTIRVLNFYRHKYLETKNKQYWWQMIQLLPSSYNQRRTVMFNYEVLANIYKSRKNHKLDEWVEFCKWEITLPYSELITGDDKNN